MSRCQHLHAYVHVHNHKYIYIAKLNLPAPKVPRRFCVCVHAFLMETPCNEKGSKVNERDHTAICDALFSISDTSSES